MTINELRKKINIAITNNAELNGLDGNNLALIHHAAFLGSVDSIIDLLTAGANVDQVGKDGETALMAAAQCGHLDIVTKLIEARADVNHAGIYGWTALMFAAQFGHLNIVTKLIEEGANVEQASKKGATALLFAATKGHIDIINRLIEVGASINLALVVAVECSQLDVVNKFIDGSDVNQANNGGWTALMIAAEMGDIEIVTKLIDKGANINLTNKSGATALMPAANEGHLDIVNKLIDYGADVNQKCGDGMTALKFAAAKGHTNIIKRLIEAGAKVNLADNDGWTALIVAANSGQRESIDVLIENNADYNLRCNKDKTAKDHAKTEDISQHIQKRVNEHQYDILINHPKYRNNKVFTQIPECPISKAPISYVLCSSTNGYKHRFEKSELIIALSMKQENPYNREPLTLSTCTNDQDEQQKIDNAWEKVNELYIEYQKGQSDQAQVSMFSASPTPGESKKRKRNEPKQNPIKKTC